MLCGMLGAYFHLQGNVMYYIQIEDLAANALIELLETSKDNRSVSFSVLSKYGNVVVEKLRKENKEVYLLVSRDTTYAFLSDYTDFFDIDDSFEIITLKEDKTIEDLKTKFRSNIALDVLMAFISKEAVNVLKKAC